MSKRTKVTIFQQSLFLVAHKKRFLMIDKCIIRPRRAGKFVA